ncbi:hypothetical protein BGZ76_001728 [Entomortierella beljakovae]|nr:hypothetical protein BGZ76_001728 [Entomortierella beljakovae]
MNESTFAPRIQENTLLQDEKPRALYPNISSQSTLEPTLRRPEQVEVDIGTSSIPQEPSSDSSSDTGIVIPRRTPLQNSIHQQARPSSKEEESDIERYSVLLKKSTTLNSSDEQENIDQDIIRRYTGTDNDLELGIVPGGQPNDSSQLNEKTKSVLFETKQGTTPAHTPFSLQSITSGIFSRLFGSQQFTASDPSSSASPSKGKQRSSDNGTNISLAGPPVSKHPSHEEQAQVLSRNMSTNRVLPTRSGGILSNLLKLQALSISPPERSQRKRRSRPHRPRTRKFSSKGSIASDIARASAGRDMFSSRKASVISLPGLLMTAPMGVGMRSNSTSGSTLVQSPESSTTFLNAPSADNALRMSTSASCPNGFRTSEGHCFSPTIPKEGTLSPLNQYLQTGSACSTRSSVSVDDGTSTYSGVSHDPILAAIRLNQQIELTEAMAEILLRQDLLIRFCKSFIRYGAPSHRIERAMESLSKILEVDGSFAFLPGLMMVSFGDSDTHTSETHLIKCSQGFEMGRLAQVHKIARGLANGDIDPSEGLESLKAVNDQKPLYNVWVILVSSAVFSGAIAPLVFDGSWYDMLAGMGLGTIVGLATEMASHFTVYTSVFEVSTSILVAFVAKGLRDYVCFTGVVLSGIVMLLPGLGLTTAIMELSSRHIISGSVRMFYSLMYCLFLGFGISIGSDLWDAVREPLPGDMKMGYCHPATDSWKWLLFPLMGISVSIQLQASPRQWPMMVICSSVGYARLL